MDAEKKKKINVIVRIASEFFNIPEKDIYAKTKYRKNSRARAMIFLFLNTKCSISASVLSAEFNRCLRVIRWYLAQIKNYILIYDDYRKEYEDFVIYIEKQLLHY